MEEISEIKGLFGIFFVFSILQRASCLSSLRGVEDSLVVYGTENQIG